CSHHGRTGIDRTSRALVTYRAHGVIACGLTPDATSATYCPGTSRWPGDTSSAWSRKLESWLDARLIAREGTMATSLGIVVGIDCSETAQRALVWALDAARLRGLPVTAVHGWDYDHYPAGVLVQVGTLEDETRKMLDGAVDPWRDEYRD